MIRAVLAEMPEPRRWILASIYLKRFLTFSNVAATGHWPGKSPGIRLPHRLADHEIVLLSHPFEPSF
jgi:hypothetical protein